MEREGSPVTLLARVVTAPMSVDIRRGAIRNLAPLLADRRISAGGHVAVAVGRGQGADILEVIAPALTNAETYVVEDSSRSTAQQLANFLSDGSFDAVVAIGGGRVLDVAKYAGSRAGIPMVAVATNLAHDGLCSPVAVLDHHGRKHSYGVQGPLAVAVDLDYVLRAPAPQRRSGVGDVISNICALADWELGRTQRQEPVDGLAAAMARTSAEAVLAQQEDLDDEAFTLTLANSLVLSGLAMSVAGSSRPCSGACHEISHAIDVLFPGTASHGEQVALGALFATFLRGDDGDLDRLSACVRRYDLPLVPEQLGLSQEQFTDAIALAPTTRPDRYTILEHVDLGWDDMRKRVHDYVVTVGR